MLAPLLISQHDADMITAATNAWTLGQIFPETDDPTEDSVVLSFDIQKVSQSHPMAIIRTLISICMCFQQLPLDFDMDRLHLGREDIKAVTAKSLSAVDTYFLPNDDFTCTIEGLGCLMLLATFHITRGMLKRAWLLIRKGVSIAQLLGFDKKPSKTVKLGEFGSETPESYIWEGVMLADRFVSVILGVPCGASDDSLNLDALPTQLEGVDIDHYFTQRLCAIAGRIVERNRAQSLQSFQQHSGRSHRLVGQSEHVRYRFIWNASCTNYGPFNSVSLPIFPSSLEQGRSGVSITASHAVYNAQRNCSLGMPHSGGRDGSHFALPWPTLLASRPPSCSP